MRAARRVAAAAVLALLLGLVAPGPSTAATGLIVWAPAEQAEVLRTQLADGFRGEAVTVVAKDLEAIRADLATVDLAAAPDVIWADSAWTGELVAARIVKRVTVSQSLRARFPANLLEAFRYGFADYGMPVTFQNEALVVNLDMVAAAPATFADLERQAARLIRSGEATVGIAVGQGPAGQEHLLGPLFTGLGGYLFGKNPAGGLDPYNIGLAGPAFLANADRIDGWNDVGLISAENDAAAAQRAFARAQAPYWITGPWSAAAIRRLPFELAVVPVPVIVDGIVPTPFVAVAGAMVTVYADRHGVAALADALVRRHFGSARAQSAIAAATVTAPALTDARVSPAVRGFAQAGVGGTPMPNITQAAVLWGQFARAWARATDGEQALPAATAFTLAGRSYLQAVG